jgi:hypothetical protein
MQPSTDLTWQIFSWKAAVGAALVAVLAALAKGIWALWQQRQELRWKQAELARELMDKWFSWAGSNNALRMVDEGAGEYSVEGYGTHQVDPSVDIPRALAVTGSRDNWQSVSNSELDRLVRKSFDVLLYCFERVEHSIQIGVVKRGDVAVPAEYYVKQLARFYAPIATYMEHVEFPRARQFLERFSGWNSAANRHERLVSLRQQLDKAFAEDTAYPGTIASGETTTASAGHCAVVAAIVQQEFGGQMLSTHVDGEEHWFNRITSVGTPIDVDLTGDQFGGPKVQVGLPGYLYPNAIERPFDHLQHEALVRAQRLADRAGLGRIAQRFQPR